MGRAHGFPRLPTEILKLRGSKRAKEREAVAPKFSNGVGSCPVWLSAEAKAEWRRLVKEIDAIDGMAQRPDRGTLVFICEAWGDSREFGKAIEASLKANGRNYDAPLMQLVRLKNAASERYVKFAVEFGFTPASRSKVVKPSKPVAGPQSITGFARKRDVS